MISKFCKFSAFSLEFKSFSRSLDQFFLTVGQNNFGNKIPFLFLLCCAIVLISNAKQNRMKCSDNSPRFSSASPMHQCLEFLITFLLDTTLCSPFPSNQLLAKKIAKQEFCGKLLTRALMDPTKRFFSCLNTLL